MKPCAGLFFTFQRRPPVAIYLLGCLIAVCYVVKLERVLCRTCRWEGVKRWDAFRLGALFDLFLVSGHLLGVLLGFSLFLGSLFLWCCFHPFAPKLCGWEVGLLWIGVREGRKAVRVPWVATLVLLDRRPLQLPPFCEGAGFGMLVLCLSLPL